MHLSPVLADPTELKITPATISKNPNNINSTFDVYANISNVVDLFGFEIKITWDNALIIYDSFDKTPLNSTVFPVGYYEPLTPSPQIGPGTFRFAAVSTGGSGSGFTGSSPLFRLTFKIVKACNFPLSTSIHFNTTKLSNSQYQSITPAIIADGLYEMSATAPALEFKLVNPDSKPFEICKTFMIKVNVTHICASLKDYDFVILYEEEFLKLTNVSWTGGVLGGTGDQASYVISPPGVVHIQDTGGIIWSSDSGLLFTLVFHIEFDDSIEHIWRVNHHADLTGEVSFQDAKLSFLEGNITKNGISMPSAVPVSARLIQGDVNCDGEVGIVGDLRTVAIYYDKTPLDPDWSTISKYDLTEDNIIDLFDLVVIATNYPYPP
jgi:hypothetical protein